MSESECEMRIAALEHRFDELIEIVGGLIAVGITAATSPAARRRLGEILESLEEVKSEPEAGDGRGE